MIFAPVVVHFEQDFYNIARVMAYLDSQEYIEVIDYEFFGLNVGNIPHTLHFDETLLNDMELLRRIEECDGQK